MKYYIGVKLVQAEPEERNGEEGYKVVYPDGYVSWSPKSVFEKAYFNLENNNSISEKDVDNFIGMSEVTCTTVGEKTTLSTILFPTNWNETRASSCIDIKNYDEKIGHEINIEHIKNRVWNYLGFLLQWAFHGLKKENI